MSNHPYRVVGVAGSGAIATGLAAVASTQAESVWLLARSESSGVKAMETILRLTGRIEGADPERIRMTTSAHDLHDCDIVVEAIIEDHDAKSTLLAVIGEAAPGADLATTTSSLSVTELGRSSGHTEKLFGLHVFNPVPAMELVEVIIPEGCEKPSGTGRSSGAGASARPRCSCPTPPASSSIDCSSPTSSTRSG